MQAKIFTAKIISKKIIAEDTMEVVFGFESDFDFIAGQYARIILPKLLYEDEKNYRNFSIASSPSGKRIVTIAFRESSSGFKRTLLELPVNSAVEIEGAFGSFNLIEDASRPVVFIAGGIGITPFMSMLRFAAEQKLPHRITLIYANQKPESAAYLNELEKLEKENQNIVIKTKFGLLDADFIKKTVDNRLSDVGGQGSNVAWYIAGPAPMVVATRKNLSEFGVLDKDIYF